ESERRAAGDVKRATSAASSVELSDRRFPDVGLLFRCMARFNIDARELAQSDPLLFRELQGLCTLCRSREQCAGDLAREFDDVGLEKWREYCPNAATLTMLGAVQNCALAAQYLKAPRSSG